MMIRCLMMFVMISSIESLLYCSKEQLRKDALMKGVKGCSFTRNDNTRSCFGDDKFTSVKTSKGQYLHIHPSGKVSKQGMFGLQVIGYVDKGRDNK